MHRCYHIADGLNMDGLPVVGTFCRLYGRVPANGPFAPQRLPTTSAKPSPATTISPPWKAGVRRHCRQAYPLPVLIPWWEQHKAAMCYAYQDARG